jgi:NAD+ kinase
MVHPTRTDAGAYAAQLSKPLIDAGFTLFTNREGSVPGAQTSVGDEKFEVALVLGGDGTILRGAEFLRGQSVPILGINMGSVGFLAEVVNPEINLLVKALMDKHYEVEPRLVLKYEIERDGKVLNNGWALNEVTIVRTNTQMVELFVQIDDRPLSRWGCDGVICATPTGSTAYAFSAGGPVMWPEVDAMVLLPLAAHALFAKPMVISPESIVAIDVESATAEISADGMRKVDLRAGDRIRISRDSEKVLLSHIDSSVFTDRLVAKFKLPIEGWRGERA